jgi:hypothetical protein
MKTRILAGIAALAFLGATPAYAEDCENIRQRLNVLIDAYNHLLSVTQDNLSDLSAEGFHDATLSLEDGRRGIREGREDYHRCLRGG